MEMDGKKIDSHPSGNNVAFVCLKCSHPVLAVLGPIGSMGISEDKPTTCKGCGSNYVLEPDNKDDATKLFLSKL